MKGYLRMKMWCLYDLGETKSLMGNMIGLVGSMRTKLLRIRMSTS